MQALQPLPSRQGTQGRELFCDCRPGQEVRSGNLDATLFHAPGRRGGRLMPGEGERIPC